MPNTVAQHAVATFTSPVNGTTPIDANTVRGNDNTTRTSYNNHDADPGIHLQSSTLASRPVAGTAGRKWITADTGSYRVWYDDGTTWQEVTYLSGGGGTISGNLLITGTLGVTGLITASGGVSGNVTGNLTGNASTATALATARNINGVSFNGTADITVTAAAGTLSGSTLASGVTASSLTSVGTLTALTVAGNLAVDTNTLFVDAVNNRVGVGTASPALTLDVNGSSVLRGNVRVTGPTSSASLTFAGASAVTDGQFSITSRATRSFVISDDYQGLDRLAIDASGNLGLGVTPSAWASAFRVLQISGGCNLFGVPTDADNVGLTANAVFDSVDSRWEYVGSGFATLYQHDAGTHAWFTAPSGTAGNAISFTQAMTLDASGNLLVGLTSAAAKLDVISTGTDLTLRVRSANNNEVVRVESTGTALSLLRFINTSNNAVYAGSSSGAFVVATTSVDRLQVKVNGQTRFVPLSADPSGAETGDVYYNSSTNKLRVYNGAWVDLH